MMTSDRSDVTQHKVIYCEPGYKTSSYLASEAIPLISTSNSVHFRDKWCNTSKYCTPYASSMHVIQISMQRAYAIHPFPISLNLCIYDKTNQCFSISSKIIWPPFC